MAVKSFAKQLLILLKKNFKLKFRAKTLFIAELFWPTFFFFFLVNVRENSDIVKQPMCYYAPKGMPSSGLFPMLQTYFCSIPNGCVNTTPHDFDLGSASRKLPLNDLIFAIRDGAYNSTTISDVKKIINTWANLLSAVSRMNAEQIAYSPINVTKFWSKTDMLDKNISIPLIDKINELQFTRTYFVDILQHRLRENDFREKFCDPQFFIEYLKSSNLQNSDIMDTHESMCKYFPLDETINMKKNARTLGDVMLHFIGHKLSGSDYFLLFQIEPLVKMMNNLDGGSIMAVLNQINAYKMSKNNSKETDESFMERLGLLSNTFCGQQLDGLDEILNRQKRMEQLRDQVVRKDPKTIDTKRKTVFVENFINAEKNRNLTRRKICKKYSYHADDVKCWKMFKKYKFPKKLSSQMYALLRGHILVTPNNTVVKHIVDEMNLRLDELLVLRNLFIFWYDGLDIYPNEFERSKLYNISKIMARMYFNADKSLNITYNHKKGKLFYHLAVSFMNETWRNETFFSLKNDLREIYDFLLCFRPMRFDIVKDEGVLEKHGSCLTKHNQLFAGIVFTQLNENSESLPSNAVYKIRMADYLVDKTNQIKDDIWNPKPRDRPFLDLQYAYFGFTFLQDIINEILIRYQTKKTEEVGIYVQQFPTNCYRIDLFMQAIERLLPTFTILAWMFSVTMILKNLVTEKSLRLKEYLKVMGVGNFVNWLAWFTISIAMITLSIIIIVITVKEGKILEYSSMSCIFLYFFLYGLAVISEAFMMSTIFDKPNLAASLGSSIYFILYLPFSPIVSSKKHMTLSSQLSVCLIPQIAFGMGCSLIAQFESTKQGMQWDNLNRIPPDGTPLTLKHVFGMLLVDTVVGFVLTWYIENVFPGAYGIPRPFYFPFTKSYWLGEMDYKAPYDQRKKLWFWLFKYSSGPSDNRSFRDGKVHEKKQLEIGVRVMHLTKSYNLKSSAKKALNNLSVDFYDGQITTVLGPNGAGKTTMMSILCGLLPPTKGSVEVYGLDLLANLDYVRQSIGFCPQHNILFDKLTVYEHLYFYATLKGVDEDKIQSEIQRLLLETKLLNRKDEYSKNLSGGMKRKLSIAISFVGDAKTVILDEPTAGVDPYSRRSIWDLLLKRKAGRTIILSTHFFDESEILGDRIAIIAGGRLRCCGSSIYLKNQYKAGYKLSFVRTIQERASKTQVAQFVGKLKNFVATHVPNAKVVRASAHEVQFMLSNKSLEEFQPLVREIDQNLSSLDCTGYGLSENSLEEIFRQEIMSSTGQHAEEYSKPSEEQTLPYLKRKSEKNNPDISSSDKKNDDESEGGISTTVSDTSVENQITPDMSRFRAEIPRKDLLPSLGHHCSAFIKKRILITVREWSTFISAIVIPVCIISMTLSLLLVRHSKSVTEYEYGPLLIDPDMYEPPSTSFFSLSNPQDDVASANVLKSAVENMVRFGLGNKCHLNDSRWFKNVKCRSIDAWQYTHPNYVIVHNESSSCECTKSGVFRCHRGGYKHNLESYKTQSDIILMDLTSHNITKWLVETEHMYRMKRYGGFSCTTAPEVTVSGSSEVLQENIDSLFKEFQAFMTKMEVNLTRLQSPNVRIEALDNRTLVRFFNEISREKNIKIWFNNQGWISLPAYMAAFANARLRSLLPPTDRKINNYSITTINHPILNEIEITLTDGDDSVVAEMSLSLAILIAFCSATAGFSFFIVEDNTSDCKHLLFISGMRRWFYWMLNFAFDSAIYMLTVIVSISTLLAFSKRAYVGSLPGILCLVLFLLAFGFCMIPTIYLLSLVFRSPSLAYATMLVSGFFLGSIFNALTTAYELLGQDDDVSKDIADQLKLVLIYFPPYTLSRGWTDINIIYQFYSQMGKPLEADYYADLMKWTTLGKPCAVLLLEGLISSILLLVFEYQLHSYFFRQIRKLFFDRNKKTRSYEVMAAGEDREITNANKNSALRVVNLTKMYFKGFRKRKVTVDSLCFEVQPGECFGLLGHNGAGKTTTFKMITSRVPIDYGNVFFMNNQQSIGLSTIGYCPQFDALESRMTGREIMHMYACIRGINRNDRTRIVDAYIGRLGLIKHANQQVRTYSGGLKRRLSVGVALIGEPSLILLDEPTAGLDPESRRFLWDVILERIFAGQSVLFTSNSMEECEILCNRVGILAHGKFACLDTIQGLKNKYGQGYQIAMKLEAGYEYQMADLMQCANGMFPTAKLIEKHQNLAKFQLPTTGTVVMDAITTIIRLKSIFNISGCSLNQTSLDDVFVQLAEKHAKLNEPDA